MNAIPKRSIPQDHLTKGETVKNSSVIEVELDGMVIRADFSGITSTKLTRRMEKGDVTALIEWLERIYGDQFDEIMEHFDLDTPDEWGDFNRRVIEAHNPNS